MVNTESSKLLAVWCKQNNLLISLLSFWALSHSSLPTLVWPFNRPSPTQCRQWLTGYGPTAWPASGGFWKTVFFAPKLGGFSCKFHLQAMDKAQASWTGQIGQIICTVHTCQCSPCQFRPVKKKSRLYNRNVMECAYASLYIDDMNIFKRVRVCVQIIDGKSRTKKKGWWVVDLSWDNFQHEVLK